MHSRVGVAHGVGVAQSMYIVAEFTEMLNQSFGSASQETLQELEKEISVTERIVDAASRLADLQADKQTKKERKDHLKA